MWQLCVTIDTVLKYSLTAADVLQIPSLDSRDIVNGMDGHLEQASFGRDLPLELVSQKSVP